MYHTIEYKGTTLAYQKMGKGSKTIILVHGFPEDSTVFASQYQFLKSNFLVIVPDLPGSGRSAYNSTLHSVEDFAETIEQILIEEKIEQCILFGHSMGGYIALAFAEKYPKRLLGLGLIHSTAYADSEEKKENRKRSILLMEKYGGFHFLKSVVPNLFGEKYKQQNPIVIQQLIEKGKSFETAALQQYYSIMMQRKDNTDVLKNIKVPVLFVIGEEDKAASLVDVLPQVSLVQIAVITILEQVAHMGFLEDAEKVNNAIDRLISIA